MHDTELYRKYRQFIEGLADERRSTELSLTTLHALLRQFESEAGALEPAAAGFVRDEIADQLEHEALRAISGSCCLRPSRASTACHSEG